MVSKKRSTRNKLELDAEWRRGSPTQAWELLWQRILAEIKIGEKVLIPSDALDGLLEEQNDTD